MTEDDRVADGLGHLQAAARELIAAARAVLDVAEELVEDPKAVSSLVEGLGSVVQSAARAGRGERDDDDGEGGNGGVEHIRVS